MGQSTKISGLEQRIEQQFGLSRGILLAVGVACLLLGALSVTLPFSLFGSFSRLVGFVLLASGAFKGAQLLLGLRSQTARERGWPAILLQVAIDVAMGLLLFNYWRASVRLVTIAFGLLFLIEGLVLVDMALRSPTPRSRRLLVVSGLVTLGISLVILLNLVAGPLRWAGVFVGLKLLMFGAALSWIALRALRSDSSLLYEADLPDPETGELYAVYFGTAFHLGVYIGNGEVVHYLNDNLVYKVTWNQFLENRIPQHWTYPDLPLVPVKTVVDTALSEVGKTYRYNLLTFNCENFAIFCKSGGATRSSKYAQVASGVEIVKTHPMIGLVAELNTRAVEWLAFRFGGPAGKQLSLAIRRIGSAVTNWLIATGRPTVSGRPE
jgi:uncharacterized membrane protein HdeD (DUF308 family)